MWTQLCREWANQLGSLGAFKPTPKWSWGSKPLCTFAVWALVLYWKILFGEQIGNCSKVFLFNTLIYKSPSDASTSRIHSPFLISTWLTTNVSPVGILICSTLTIKTSKGRQWNDRESQAAMCRTAQYLQMRK